MKCLKFISIIIFAFLIMGCQEKEDDDDDANKNTADLGNQDDGSTIVDLSGKTSFTIPDDTISFLIHEFGDVNFESNRGIHAVFNPDGVSAFPNEKVGGAPDYGNLLMPVSPNTKVYGGTWRYTPTDESLTHKITLRRGTLPTSTTYTIQPYYSLETGYNSTKLQEALTLTETVYENAGITIVVNTPIEITEAKFKAVSTSFYDETTSELVTQGGESTVNIFIVNDFTSSGGTVVGVAAGIPGSLKIKGNRNGVLVSYQNHIISNTNAIDSTLMGETIAHEMGHFLGLYHTTESTGAHFDPLDDTPQCEKGAPTPQSCQALDGTNLMFWNGDSFAQQTLTPDQVYVLQRSPLGK